MKLRLFIKSWCPWCQAAIQRLNTLGLPYETLDIEKDPAARDEMVRLSGQHLTPVLAVSLPGGPAVLADFGPEELDPFLRKHSLLP